MRGCIEEGILQSYVDGELSPAMAESVATHIAACQSCARAFDEASAETMLFSKAFEAEAALEVPTLRLRERIESAIAELERPQVQRERQPSWSLGAWFSSLMESFRVSPQRAVGFASLVAVIAFAAIFAVIKLRPTNGIISNSEPSLVAKNDGEPKKTTSAPETKPSPAPDKNEGMPASDGGKSTKPPANNSKPKKQAKPLLVPEPDQLPNDVVATAKPLAGEETYLKAIDSLSSEIASSGETNMRPSLRAEYERNLAVVDQAIDSTRRAARRNPKNQDAAQFLYSSYQSKVDLLTAVAEQVRPTIATR